MRNRLFFDGPLHAGHELELPKQAAHYIGRVLRLQEGDCISLFNGDDGEWQVNILKLEKNSAHVAVQAALPNAAESPLSIRLIQGISRGERMDFVVQKATELGVQRISPVLTNHGVVRLDKKRAEKRQLHWQGIAHSACEQCGRIDPPTIDAPVGLNDWLGKHLIAESARVLLLPTASRRLIDSIEPQGAIELLIGPEGGLSEKEVGDAGAAGFIAASLGPRVLRTETAALAAITLVQSSWGDL